jgi:hypothetical protein
VFVNLTPHDITIFGDDDTEVTTIPTSGVVARIAESAEGTEPIDGVATTQVVLGQIQGLPESEDGTVYVVSMPLLMGMRAMGDQRLDVRYPYGQVRDEQGRIKGCRSLATL